MIERNKLNIYSVFLCLGLLLIFAACAPKEDAEETVDIAVLLPEGAMAEITGAHPDFKVSLVGEKIANVETRFGEKYLHIAGVENEELRERLSKYVLQYLENPNKKAEDKARKEAYEKLPPKEKMSDFVERTKVQYPDFAYTWVGLNEGNVKLEYGDNTLLITGVENKGARDEIAFGLRRIQQEIDKANPGENK